MREGCCSSWAGMLLSNDREHPRDNLVHAVSSTLKLKQFVATRSNMTK
jgi:hypothetical protein